jgi:hypothetical protein
MNSIQAIMAVRTAIIDSIPPKVYVGMIADCAEVPVVSKTQMAYYWGKVDAMQDAVELLSKIGEQE